MIFSPIVATLLHEHDAPALRAAYRLALHRACEAYEAAGAAHEEAMSLWIEYIRGIEAGAPKGGFRDRACAVKNKADFLDAMLAEEQADADALEAAVAWLDFREELWRTDEPVGPD